jgi:hypothetical protein
MSKNEANDVDVKESTDGPCLRIGDAKIFMDEVKKGKLDEETFKQIQIMAANPGVSHVRVMPDCHASVSCVVGLELLKRISMKS